MIVPPRPWSGFHEGVYLPHKAPFIRTMGVRRAAENFKVYNAGQVTRAMDYLGSIPWCINRRIYSHMQEAYQRDMGIAEIPRQKSQAVVGLPSDIADRPEDEQKKLRIEQHNIIKDNEVLQS